jgi:translation elongation factor EF-4
MATGAIHLTEQVGVFTPKSVSRESLSAGGVGFVIAGIKDLKDAKVGDTVTLVERPAAGSAARLQGDPAAGVRRASTRWSRTATRRCATRSPSCS